MIKYLRQQCLSNTKQQTRGGKQRSLRRKTEMIQLFLQVEGYTICWQAILGILLLWHSQLSLGLDQQYNVDYGNEKRTTTLKPGTCAPCSELALLVNWRPEITGPRAHPPRILMADMFSQSHPGSQITFGDAWCQEPHQMSSLRNQIWQPSQATEHLPTQTLWQFDIDSVDKVAAPSASSLPLRTGIPGQRL